MTIVQIALFVGQRLGWPYIMGLLGIALLFEGDGYVWPMIYWSFIILIIRIVCEWIYFGNKTKLTP
jgi:hypothetical protein